MIISLIVIVALIIADQAVKFWTVATLELGQSASFLPGLVELLRVHNYGAAWSSFSGMRWLLVALTSAVMIFLFVLLVKKMVRHPMGLMGLTLILSGGVGNLIDRIRLGYVVDMFHFEFWPSYPVFNVADICVVAGVIIFLVYYLFFYEKCDSKSAREGQRKDKE